MFEVIAFFLIVCSAILSQSGQTAVFNEKDVSIY